MCLLGKAVQACQCKVDLKGTGCTSALWRQRLYRDVSTGTGMYSYWLPLNDDGCWGLVFQRPKPLKKKTRATRNLWSSSEPSLCDEHWIIQ